MPPADVDITPGLVARLLSEQHPDLADLEIKWLANGWDNALFRLGADLAVRLPRRVMAAALVANELRWLPGLAARLPLPVPVPTRAGRPSGEYPYQWAVVPFFDGEPLGISELADPDRAAELIGTFVGSLHHEAPPGAPRNPYRGQPLAERHVVTTQRLEALGAWLSAEGIEVEPLHGSWVDALEAEPWSGPPIWLHGDLHPMNIIQHEGHPSAVIDFGDLTAGDPATDLMVAWYLFDPVRREVFRTAVGATGTPLDDATWERGRGWAITHAAAVLANSDDNPEMRSVGLRALDRVINQDC
jgi:aminoglycoside phosphotransferase (APT) family kinase protein